MSTFAVFGMTRAYALAEARKRTPTHRFEKDKDGNRRRVEMTSDDWEAAVQDRANSIMGGEQEWRSYASPLMRPSLPVSSSSSCESSRNAGISGSGRRPSRRMDRGGR